MKIRISESITLSGRVIKVRYDGRECAREHDLIRQLEPIPIPTCRDGHSTSYMPVGESQAG